MTSHMDVPHTRMTFLAGGLLGLSLLFMIQAYFGIDHDSVLYLGEALRLRMPDILDQDLFFKHGSQGRYTLFPHLVAALIPFTDVSALFLWGTVAGMTFFAAASWFALRILLPAGERFLPWLALLTLPTAYGAYRIFGYAEPFFTPRLYAEPLCLLALAFLTRHRLKAAAACLLLAGLLHPLQALGASVILWVWLVLGDRRWLHALWLLPVPVLLGAAGIAPFDGLLHRLDPDTNTLAYNFSRHLFVGGWRAEDFQTLAFDLLLLLSAARTGQLPLRRWAQAGAIGMVLALGTSYLLADVLRLSLPAGLQLWRAHWLAHWLAMALVGVLVQRDIAARSLPRLLVLALAVTLAYGQPGWYWIPLGALYLLWPTLQPRLRPAVQTLLAVGCGLAIAVFFFDYIGNVHAEFVKAHRQLVQVPFDRAFFTFPALTLTLAIAASLAWQRSARIGRGLLVLLLLPFSIYAGLRWDARPPLYRALEAHPFRPDLFGVALPTHAQIYWGRASSVGNWLVINRPDYYSPQQLSGAIFSPGLASDAQARIARLRPLFKGIETCIDPRLDTDSRRRCRLPEAALRRACALDTSPAPPPDYLVLPYPQQAPVLGTWSVTDPTADIPVLTFRLYACRDIRAAAPTNRASAPGLSNLSQTPG